MLLLINKRLSVQFKHVIKITTKQRKIKINTKLETDKQTYVEVVDKTKSSTIDGSEWINHRNIFSKINSFSSSSERMDGDHSLKISDWTHLFIFIAS